MCSQLQMWELDYQEGLVPKNWCSWIVLEKTWESLGQQRDQTSQFWENQPLIFIGRTDAPIILWPPDVKSQLTGKDPDAGKVWRQEKEQQRTRCLDGIINWMDEFEQTLGDGERQASLVCCSPWGHKESDTTEWLNNNRSCGIWDILILNF